MEEVSKHNRVDDAWIIIDGRVVDVTKWAKYHPGGEKVLLGFLGRDATAVFNAFHPLWVKETRLSFLEKGEVIGASHEKTVPHMPPLSYLM
jgi:cytochrome b involved in lipid metabolism